MKFEDFSASGKQVPPTLLNDEPWYFPIHGREFEKSASQIFIPERIKIAIANIKPRDDGIHLLVHGLGGAEYWGDNANGDAFPEYINGEPHLVKNGGDYGYGTFEKFAYPYLEHKNHDPIHSIGEKIKYAAYNEPMHRVEVVVFLKHAKIPDLVEKVARGDDVAFSMGTRVPYDICSKCHNQAKNRHQYCEHLKYAMRKIHDDGTKNFAINPFVKFFDMSLVGTPADPQAMHLFKIAKTQTPLFNVPAVRASILIPIDLKKESDDKQAEMDKKVPLSIEKVDDDLVGSASKVVPHDLEDQKPHKSVVIILKKSKPIEHKLSDLMHSGIFPMQEELDEAGIKDEDIPEKMSECPAPDMGSLKELAPAMTHRSMHGPYLTVRIMKRASECPEKQIKVSNFNTKLAHLFSEAMLDNDWQERYIENLSRPEILYTVIPEQLHEKRAAPYGLKQVAMDVSAPAILSAFFRGKAQRGQELNPLQSFIAKHPLLSGGLAAFLHSKASGWADSLKGLTKRR